MAVSFFGKGFYADDMYAGTQDPKTITRSTTDMVNREVCEPVEKLRRSIEKMNSIRPSADLENGSEVLEKLKNEVQKTVRSVLQESSQAKQEEKDVDVKEEDTLTRSFKL